MSKRKMGRKEAAASGLEEALVDRLRQLEWPKPTAEVRQRCLDDILERMAEVKKEEPERAKRTQIEYRARGFGERHSLTRRVGALSHRQPLAAPQRALSHRQPLRSPQRQVRVATVLW